MLHLLSICIPLFEISLEKVGACNGADVSHAGADNAKGKKTGVVC